MDDRGYRRWKEEDTNLNARSSIRFVNQPENGRVPRNESERES